MSEHILIIEDDIDIANIERDYLMVAGYDVTVMNNGTDGIDASRFNYFGRYVARNGRL